MAASSGYNSLHSAGSLGSFFPSVSTPPESLKQMEGVSPSLFKDKIDEQFICGLCTNVLRFPMQSGCGCRFCYGCLYNFIGDKKGVLECPSCEDEFDASEVARDNFVRKQLERSIVYCPHKSDGCDIETKLKNLDDHVKECAYQPLECIHKSRGCTAVVLRGRLAEHIQKECLYRLATCEFCDQEFPAADLEAHQLKCKASAVECPNECGSNRIHQDKLDEHVQLTCPLTEIDCIFKNYGCRHRCPRKEMDHHKADNTPSHLEYVIQWQEQTTQRYLESQRLIQELTNNRGIMESKVDTLTSNMQALQMSAKKNETHIRETQKIVVRHSDLMDNLELLTRQAAKKEEVIEMKKTMFKPMQEKQDQMDDRLKRLERGGIMAGGGRGGNGGGGEVQGGGGGGVSNARMMSVENQLGMHAVRLAEHDLRFQVLETANYEGVLLWKIKDFARRKRDADNGKTLSLYSQPFYTSRYGYKMCARIYLNGDGMGKGTHVSLFFVVMRGDYDALLPWPFRQKVTLMLLDQETGRRHLSDSFRPDPKSSSFQRPTTEMNIASGCPLFVNQTVLKDNTYVKDDVIFIKVIVDTSDLYGP